MTKLSANLSLLFTENEFIDRFKEAKKNGFEMGDYISEFKIENSDRPSKNIVYPIAILLLVVFGYFNLKRKE